MSKFKKLKKIDVNFDSGIDLTDAVGAIREITITPNETGFDVFLQIAYFKDDDYFDNNKPLPFGKTIKFEWDGIEDFVEACKAQI